MSASHLRVRAHAGLADGGGTGECSFFGALPLELVGAAPAALLLRESSRSPGRVRGSRGCKEAAAARTHAKYGAAVVRARRVGGEVWGVSAESNSDGESELM